MYRPDALSALGGIDTIPDSYEMMEIRRRPTRHEPMQEVEDEAE